MEVPYETEVKLARSVIKRILMKQKLSWQQWFKQKLRRKGPKPILGYSKDRSFCPATGSHVKTHNTYYLLDSGTLLWKDGFMFSC